ncbi:MAG: DUF6049 family protein [Nocardiopsaceae bacterium]|nr:DUF6049 family protein [Nocardiopsaceae bacterium]
MARSHAVWQRQRQATAGGPRGRRVARALVVTGIAGFCAALPLLSGTAAAAPAHQPSSEPLTLTVMSVSPSYAEQGKTVTITGQIRNVGSTATTGLSVQLMSSHTPFSSRSDLESFASGESVPALPPVDVRPVLIQNLGSGQSWRFTIHMPVSKLGLTCFGVYPLVVQVTDSAFDIAADPVPLPYWPPNAMSCTGQRRPQPFPISWVWPLIDTPHQNFCAGLTDNSLPGRIAPKGRLGYLLKVGATYSSRARLTWAVDPSLLAGVRAMTRPYQVDATGCAPKARQPADRNAASWLAELRKATAGQSLFLTPYADVDVAALLNLGNKSDVHMAFKAAAEVGHQILHRSAAPAPLPAGPRQFSAIAWPAPGIASGSVLAGLATQHVDTLILGAPAVSPFSYTPGAVSSRKTGIGVPLHALLADNAITTLLGSRAAASNKPGDVFATSQLYVAETAMIASEAPSNRRPIMVAPPRRWDPSRQLAGNLLADTVSAPWLEPSSAAQMVSLPAHVYNRAAHSPSAAELPADLLRKVSGLDHRIKLLQSIRVKPDPALNRAVYAIESSAWRGKGVAHARALLKETRDYVDRQLSGITIRGGGGRSNAYRVTFGGKNAQVPISIHSSLRYPVWVALDVHANHAKVTGLPSRIKVPPLGYSPAVKLNVHVKADHGRIRLSLVAPVSSRLPHPHPLPAFPLVIIVHPTDLGTVVLVLFAAVLALFVIGSAARAIKAGRPGPPEGADDLDGSTQPPAPDEHASSMSTEEAPAGFRSQEEGLAAWTPPPPVVRLDSTVQDRSGRWPSASGWTPPGSLADGGPDDGFGPEGFPNADNRPEYPDNVDSDRSELTSAGPSAADEEPRRTTGERR